MISIMPMTEKDKPDIAEMMKVFYHSPAVLSDGSEEIYNNDIDACTGDCPFLEGYVLRDNDIIAGYAMLAKSFSTEFGKPCIWIEDIYIKDEYRGKGIGTMFFDYIGKKYNGHLFRLEAEADNVKAVSFYKKCGFEILPYLELKK